MKIDQAWNADVYLWPYFDRHVASSGERDRKSEERIAWELADNILQQNLSFSMCGH